jgi:hypothetical protein
MWTYHQQQLLRLQSRAFALIRQARSVRRFLLDTAFAGTSYSEFSPNDPAGTVQRDQSAAGSMSAVAGSSQALYAVSKTAGVWRSVGGNPWEQLQGIGQPYYRYRAGVSPAGYVPEKAFCIAVDPTQESHLAIGETDGDAAGSPYDCHLNRCGLWESFDSGQTWEYTCDPLVSDGAHQGGGSQAVRAVVFSRTGTLIFGTTTSIGRRPAHAAATEWPRYDGIGQSITALVVAQTQIWARSIDSLFVSSDDGVTWRRIDIQQPAVLPPPYPPGTRFQRNTTGSGGNDELALAAFDSIAFLPVKPNPEPDDLPNKNKCAMLIYDESPGSPRPQWSVQLVPYGDGRGEGGRRFVKSYVLACPGTAEVLGQGLQLFYGSGQEVAQASGWDAAGTSVLWQDPPVYSTESQLPDGTSVPNPSVHADIWDFHIPRDFCLDGRAIAWIAGDGGVYEGSVLNPEFFGGLIGKMSWGSRNDGLHTHTVHTLSLVRPWRRPASAGELLYTTQDNDAWWMDGLQWWRDRGLFTLGGDANWSATDSGRPRAPVLVVRHLLLARRDPGQQPDHAAVLFYPASYKGTEISLNNQDPGDGAPAQFAFIQTWPGDPPKPLDAVYLVKLPLADQDGKPIADPPGGTGQESRFVLLRNPNFEQNPDARSSNLQTGWHIEADNLPAKPSSFVVSRPPMSDPTYYLVASDSLYKFTRSSGWSGALVTGVKSGGSDSYGPCFVHPYNPNRCYVVTDAGIQVTDDGSTFTVDPVLTALVTESSRYPLDGVNPESTLKAVGSQIGTTRMGTLSHLIFEGSQVVAASPFTGIFYADQGAGCLGAGTSGYDQAWKNLSASASQPTPRRYASSLAMDETGVYVGIQGRSVLVFSNPAASSPATYFDPVTESTSLPPRTTLGTLRDSLGKPLPNQTVQTRVRRVLNWGTATETQQTVIDNALLSTDASGTVNLPQRLPPGDYVVEFRYAGDGFYAAAETWFRHTIVR